MTTLFVTAVIVAFNHPVAHLCPKLSVLMNWRLNYTESSIAFVQMNCDELYLKEINLLFRENSEWYVSLPNYFQWYTNFPNSDENLNYLKKIKIYFSSKSDLATTVGRVLKRNTFGLVTICPPLVFHSFCFPHFLKIAPADSLLAKGTVNRMGALKILALPKRGGVAPQPRFIWWIWHSVQRST